MKIHNFVISLILFNLLFFAEQIYILTKSDKIYINLDLLSIYSYNVRELKRRFPNVSNDLSINLDASNNKTFAILQYIMCI